MGASGQMVPSAGTTAVLGWETAWDGDPSHGSWVMVWGRFWLEAWGRSCPGLPTCAPRGVGVPCLLWAGPRVPGASVHLAALTTLSIPNPSFRLPGLWVSSLT